MALTNSYCQLDEFLASPEIDSAEPVDDVFIEATLVRASREFDGDTGHWFYASTQTRYFDLPTSRVLKLDAPLLTVTTLLNGDSSEIASTEYNLWPYNGPHATELRLKQSSTTIWQIGSAADTERIVSLTGTWGYVDRTATAPESAMVVHNSKLAVLMLALALYRKRHGVGVEGVARVTGAGVVITPRDKSLEYWAIVERYRRML